jgi:hypothetical protein
MAYPSLSTPSGWSNYFHPWLKGSEHPEFAFTSLFHFWREQEAYTVNFSNTEPGFTVLAPFTGQGIEPRSRKGLGNLYFPNFLTEKSQIYWFPILAFHANWKDPPGAAW